MYENYWLDRFSSLYGIDSRYIDIKVHESQIYINLRSILQCNKSVLLPFKWQEFCIYY